jgi:hypothetical protein
MKLNLAMGPAAGAGFDTVMNVLISISPIRHTLLIATWDFGDGTTSTDINPPTPMLKMVLTPFV